MWPSLDNAVIVQRAMRAADADGDGCIGRREFPVFLQCVVYLHDVWHALEVTLHLPLPRLYASRGRHVVLASRRWCPRLTVGAGGVYRRYVTPCAWPVT